MLYPIRVGPVSLFLTPQSTSGRRCSQSVAKTRMSTAPDLGAV